MVIFRSLFSHLTDLKYVVPLFRSTFANQLSPVTASLYNRHALRNLRSFSSNFPSIQYGCPNYPVARLPLLSINCSSFLEFRAKASSTSKSEPPSFQAAQSQSAQSTKGSEGKEKVSEQTGSKQRPLKASASTSPSQAKGSESSSSSSSGEGENSSSSGTESESDEHERTEAGTGKGQREREKDDRKREAAELRQTRERILLAALKHVNELGWSRQALVRGALDAGLPSTSHALISHPRDMVLMFVRRSNSQFAVELEAKANEMAAGRIPREGTTEFVKNAVLARLDYIKPYLSSWPEALFVLWQPRLPTSFIGTMSSYKPPFLAPPEPLAPLLELVDQIWATAGDRSTDLNWYTKRILLAYVYTSAELYLLNDRSASARHTRYFVGRRLAEVTSVGGALRDVQHTTKLAAETLEHIAQIAANFTRRQPPRFS